MDGKLVIELGEITRKICERARMTDLVVMKVEHPPLGGLASLRSPFRTVTMNSSCPSSASLKKRLASGAPYWLMTDRNAPKKPCSLQPTSPKCGKPG